MNKNRRKTLSELENKLTNYSSVDCKSDHSFLEEIKSQLETIREEEQEYYDNMPDSFKDGEKGDIAQSAIDNLESAIDELETLLSTEEDNDSEYELDVTTIEQVVSSIQEAAA